MCMCMYVCMYVSGKLEIYLLKVNNTRCIITSV